MTALNHEALIYDTEEQFLAATLPFCLDGLGGGDAVLAVTTPANIDLLRQGLGSDAASVEFISAGDWYEAPGRTLAAYHRYVDERTDRHPQVRIIGEPVWHGRDELESAEWTRYESVINAAFAQSPAWIMCPYDTRVLPAAVVEDARRTHPRLVQGGTAVASDLYRDPSDGAGGWSRTAQARGETTILPFETDLSTARDFVTVTADSLGLSPAATERLVFAFNEVASNALQHGGGSGRVSLWREGRRVVCDVTDAGSENFAPWYLGYLPPDPRRTSGHGLWVARQLVDLLEIDGSDSGTVVRLHLSA